MRIILNPIVLYKFEELSPEAQQYVVDNCDINHESNLKQCKKICKRYNLEFTEDGRIY